MKWERYGFDDHDRFQQLCALSVAGDLSADERAELEAHLESCGACRALRREYRLLAREGMPILAARFDRPRETGDWDASSLKDKLLERVAGVDPGAAAPAASPRVVAFAEPAPHRRRLAPGPAVAWAAAALLAIGIGFGAYRAGQISEVGKGAPDVSAEARYRNLVKEKEATDRIVRFDSQRLDELRAEGAGREAEIRALRAALRASQKHANQIAALSDDSAQRLEAVTAQRDALNAKLSKALGAYQTVQSQLAGLQTERDEAAGHSAVLETQIGELSAANASLAAENGQQDRQIKTLEKYLTEDRDIRDLMGARQLYIADVFDVAGNSRTRKPYGRVFYTKGKSLIFYAFDLDRRPGVKETSTFRVWGQNDMARSRPVDLGILYRDSKTNRRWVLRCDDPQQLAEIDTVFVTVQPNAHSTKPMGKPFLYASLRNQPNHP